jgi:DNA repair exonuclease SbcCD ATPase subunit
MKILNLHILNFGAIGEVLAGLDDKGLVLIQGDNKDDSSQDSNGSGKSTIPDALCWAFFGETAKGQSGDKIVNRTAKKETSVEVTVVDEDTDDVFRITRYRKHSTHKNMLRLELQTGPSWKDQTLGTDKLTQVLVNRVLGCNLEVFASAIYAGQEKMPDLPSMTDKNLKILIEESAGISQLQDAYDVANRIVKERKAVVQDIAGKIANKQSNIDLLVNNRLALQTKQGDWEITQAAEIAAAEANHKALFESVNPNIGSQIDKKQAELQAKVDGVKAKIAGSDAERTEERRLSDALSDAKMVEDQAQRSVMAASEASTKAKHRVDHVGDVIGKPCKECGHVVTEDEVDLDASKKMAAELLDVAIQAHKDANEVFGAAIKSKHSASDALQAHRDSMTDVSTLTSELTSLDEHKQKLNQARKIWDAQMASVVAAKKEWDNQTALVNPFVAQIDALDKQCETIEAEIEKFEESRVEAAKSLFIAEEAFRVFSPAGVRAHILDTVTPHLNARTSHYLSTLTDGNISAVWSTVSKTAKGELREKFVIDVTSKTGGESFTDLSGGEKRKTRLACAMALQDLVASRASKPIKLFIADEIDTALDEAGQERLMSILEAKSRDKGTVLVISHNDLRDFIRNSVTITKSKGRAVLEANTVL